MEASSLVMTPLLSPEVGIEAIVAAVESRVIGVVIELLVLAEFLFVV